MKEIPSTIVSNVINFTWIWKLFASNIPVFRCVACWLVIVSLRGVANWLLIDVWLVSWVVMTFWGCIWLPICWFSCVKFCCPDPNKLWLNCVWPNICLIQRFFITQSVKIISKKIYCQILFSFTIFFWYLKSVLCQQ